MMKVVDNTGEFMEKMCLFKTSLNVIILRCIV